MLRMRLKFRSAAQEAGDQKKNWWQHSQKRAAWRSQRGNSSRSGNHPLALKMYGICMASGFSWGKKWLGNLWALGSKKVWLVPTLRGPTWDRAESKVAGNQNAGHVADQICKTLAGWIGRCWHGQFLNYGKNMQKLSGHCSNYSELPYDLDRLTDPETMCKLWNESENLTSLRVIEVWVVNRRHKQLPLQNSCMGVPWVSGNGEKHRAGRWEPRCRQKVLMRRFLTEILDGAKWVTQFFFQQKS